MADLLNIRASSERASRRKKRGEAAVDLITDLGLIKKTRTENGFLVQGNNLIPELKTAYIEAPAGLITVFGTFYGTQVYESDFFAGAVYSSQFLSTYDSVLKKYAETGLGLDAWYLILLQGQPESQVLEASPYSNMNPARFTRNASWFNTDPIGHLSGSSYQYPDSWQTAGVFPTQYESVWLSLAGTDMLYEETINACVHHEVARIGHLSGNSSLGGKTMFSQQQVGIWRPTATGFPLPVSGGYREVQPVRFTDYPFQETIRYFGTFVEYNEGILSYERLNLSTILPDPDNIPPTHTGAVMPAGLRTIMLDNVNCSCRPSGAFLAFSAVDIKPFVFTIIDLTSTEQKKHAVNPPSANSPDQDFFDSNVEERKWRISCHWLNMETGETWSFTADQFWDLLRQRVRVLSIDEDWRVAASSNAVDAGWHAALAVLWQWFGRPTHNFQVPHDTWTFHAENNDIYAWSRYYGNIKIDRTGIYGLAAGDIIVPQVVIDNDGIRPTIRYSGFLGEEGEEQHRYLCVCEKMERATPGEDLPQGQKEVKGIYYGTPFLVDGWAQMTPFLIEEEEKTWSLVHVRIVFHRIEGDESDIDHIMLLGMARERYLDDELNEIINYYSCYIDYNSESGGKWVIAAKYPGVDAIDPVFGERFSVEMSLFGDNVLSPEMMKYLSPPAAMSQIPMGPYNGYYSGLP
jgi:hypothetical protein